MYVKREDPAGQARVTRPQLSSEEEEEEVWFA